MSHYVHFDCLAAALGAGFTFFLLNMLVVNILIRYVRGIHVTAGEEPGEPKWKDWKPAASVCWFCGHLKADHDASGCGWTACDCKEPFGNPPRIEP